MGAHRSDRNGWTLARRLVLAAAVALAGCGKAPTTEGIVRDNFGRPIAGASILVDGVAATAVTDAEGRFAVAYKDGRFPATITREGYSSGSYTIRFAAEEGRPPVEAVLQRLPETPGLYLVGADGYRPVNPCTIGVFANLEPPGNWYLVEHGIPTETPFTSGAPVRFLDYGGEPPTLPRVMARVTRDSEFYRTQPPTNRDPMIFEQPKTVEVTPDFPFAGRWFDVTPTIGGVYVYSDRRTEAATNYELPDPDGACYIVTFGPAGEGWLSDAIPEAAYQAFLDKVTACWPTPPAGPDRQQVVTLRIALNPDGTVNGQPRQVRGPLDTIRQRPAYSLAANMVTAAVTGCGPYPMFAPADPALWSDLVVTFDAARLFGG